ncbi:MAG: MATE family efflux transporter [Lachnospiraceae bacterium]|nr:MATE family efflux transporter [Lachnospiraceae bacterium]
MIQSGFRRKYFGDRQFYKHVILVMLPIMIQNAITNFVSMLDNLMVGRLGTVEMSAVSVANLLVFVYNLSIFGAVSGAGIFTAQYFGKKDHEGIRYTFRFKLMISVGMTILAILLFLLAGRFLLSLYLKGEGDPAEAARILDFAYDYLRVILIGLIPHAMTQSYSSTLRETDKGVPPMVAGIIAVLVNLFLNYVLIFGHFGAPRLGVIGAAVATVSSRFVELAVVAGWTMRHKKLNPFIEGAFRSLKVPASLSISILKKGLPLMVNETLWAGGVAFLEQCYSTRGLNVVAACTISNTFFDVFAVGFISAGAAVGIIIGQQLGAGRIEEAKADARRLLVFCFLLGLGIGLVYLAAASFIPLLYNTTADVRQLATSLMMICACFFPLEGLLNGSYFMVRAGGKTLITMLTDSGLLWGLQASVAFIISRFTDFPIVPFYALIQSFMIVKALVGLWFVKQGKWANMIVTE